MGPGNREKVLLLHGISTPCLALGTLAEELVARGYRVMVCKEGEEDDATETKMAAEVVGVQSNGEKKHKNSDASGGHTFDNAVLLARRPEYTVSMVMGWQLRHHEGFIPAFVSSIRHAPIYDQKEDWSALGQLLAKRRERSQSGWEDTADELPGLRGGKILFVLGASDPVIVKEELMHDATAVLGEDGFEAVLLDAGHELRLVRTGDTTVICGVRGELLPVERIPQFRPLDKNLAEEDGGDGQETGFLPGVPPTALAQTLSTRVYSLLHSAGMVDIADLRDTEMKEGEEEELEEEEDRVVAYWVLYIDLLFVSFDGNPFDAAWAAVVAALRDAQLPVARWDPDREMVVCSRTERKKLNINGLPVACSAAVFMEKEHAERDGEGRHWILLDPDRLEETLCREVITMVVDCSDGETRIKSIEKQGGTVLGRELIRGYAGVAERRWKEISEALK
ncbi:hypothetical protein N0V88_003733 [Collariella sp. IMI 366227]|nr:hypothetical protein N0V88_003733 [Collariella sp. IMI 366227]